MVITFIITLLIFLVILSLLVLIHESGHFFVAKFFGIKVEEFGYGIPPRAWGKKVGETIYSINWLPIGGFVKLFGEDEAGGGKVSVKNETRNTKRKDDKRAFYSRSVGQRGAVIVAGVVMNTVLAFLIYYIFLSLSGFTTEIPLLSDYKFFGAQQQNAYKILVSDVAKNSPAQKAGLTAYDKILAINGRDVTGNSVKTLSFFSETITKNKGKQISLSWEDTVTGQKHTAQITPRLNPPKNEGAMGIVFDYRHVAEVSYVTPMQKAFSGISHSLNMAVYNLSLLTQLVAVSFKEHTVAPISEGVSGPVGIMRVVGDIGQITNIKDRVLQYLNLAGLLSISLAFFNVLPIPALDGGRLFFIIIEAVTRRKVSPKFEGYAHSVGMAILLGLILLVTLKDITQLFR